MAKCRISFHGQKSSKPLQNHIQEVSQGFDKHFRAEPRLTWTFNQEGKLKIAHCRLVIGQKEFFGSASATDIYAVVDSVITRLVKQMRRSKTAKRSDRRERGLRARHKEAPSQPSSASWKEDEDARDDRPFVSVK